MNVQTPAWYYQAKLWSEKAIGVDAGRRGGTGHTALNGEDMIATLCVGGDVFSRDNLRCKSSGVEVCSNGVGEGEVAKFGSPESFGDDWGRIHLPCSAVSLIGKYLFRRTASS